MILQGTILLYDGKNYIRQFVTLGSPLNGFPSKYFSNQNLITVITPILEGLLTATDLKKRDVGKKELYGLNGSNDYFDKLDKVKGVNTNILKIIGGSTAIVEMNDYNGEVVLASSLPSSFPSATLLDLVWGNGNHDGLIGKDSAGICRPAFDNESKSYPYNNNIVFDSLNHLTIVLSQEVFRKIDGFVK